MFMVAVFRFYLTKYMNYNKTPTKATASTIKEHKVKNIIGMCQRIATMGGLLPDSSFRMRKAFLCKKQTGFLQKVASSVSTANQGMGAGMMMNPAMMTDMLKGNLNMIVSTMLLFGWVSFFFSGFILAKVPFPLTQKFRTMLQRGVEIVNLDVRYVSSTSLYFLVLFGLNGLITFLFSKDSEDDEDLAQMNDMQAMQQPMPMGGGGGMPGQAPDFGKQLNTERENLELASHKYLLANSEDKLLEKWKKEPTFLLSGMSLWIDKINHPQLLRMWPPISDSADVSPATPAAVTATKCPSCGLKTQSLKFCEECGTKLPTVDDSDDKGISSSEDDYM